MTTLLAVGDLHLGRIPSALHPDLLARASELGPEAAWSRAVTEAIDRQVDAVLLAGDVVERSRDVLVAYGDLKNGIDKLTTAGIRVLAVAGNHDTLVLPRLAQEIPDLDLLGANGRWQEKSVGKLTVAGWSFPRPQVRSSPLKDFPRVTDPERVIGLLHCDRDQADSPYAPVSSADLEAAPTAAWLLGHIHQPDDLSGPRPIGYLGSVTALRASETGPRGPWLLRWTGTAIEMQHIPLAPLRFERVSVDVSDLEDPGQLAEAILGCGRDLSRHVAAAERLPEVIGMRITLTGRCRFERELPAAATQLLNESRPWKERGIILFVQKFSIETEMNLDLEELANQSDPCGLLARRLLLLRDRAGPDYRRLLDQARLKLGRISGLREFQALDAELDDAEVHDWLQRAGQRALIELVAQRRGKR